MKMQAKLSDLLIKIREYVDRQGYVKGTRYLYIAGINDLRRHFERCQQTKYLRNLAWERVLERRREYECGEIAYATFMYTWKVAEMLEQCFTAGYITQTRSKRWDSEHLCDTYERLLADYEREKIEHGYSVNTLTGERSAIRLFLLYLENKGITDASKVRRNDISAYIPIISKENPAGISGILSRLRAFFRHLISKNIVDETLILSLQLQAAVRKKVRFGFSSVEADSILDAVDRSKNVGKRDYALLLLARYTGLRAVDVINLKLRDIDWNNSEIRIIQHKTKRPLILPLENNVGNAIAEYIMQARPNSNCPEIFLRTRAPYQSLGHGNGSVITRKYAKRAGVMWKHDEYKGFHSFRRSIGTNMLAANVPLSTISEVLGHSRIDSTKPYLSADMANLKMCALPLDGFECVKEGLR